MKRILKSAASLLTCLSFVAAAPGSSAWAAVAARVNAHAPAPLGASSAGAASMSLNSLPRLSAGVSLSQASVLPSFSAPSLNLPSAVSGMSAAVPARVAVQAGEVGVSAAVEPSSNLNSAAVRPSASSSLNSAGSLNAAHLSAAQASAAPSSKLYGQGNAAVAPINKEALTGMAGLAAKKGVTGAEFGVRFDGAAQHSGRTEAAPVGAGNAADQAADMLKGDKKKELVLPGFYWGALDLPQLAKTPVNLEDEAQLRMDVYKALIQYALRPINDPVLAAKYTRDVFSGAYASEAAQRIAANSEHPVSYHWIKMLEAVSAEIGAGVGRFEEAVLDATVIDAQNDIPQAVLQRAVQLGLHRLKFPKEHGGLGLNQREYVQVLDTLAPLSGSLVGQISAQNTIGTAPMTMFGTKAQQEKYLRRLTSGEGLVSFGLTEPLAGTDLDKMTTTAVLENGKWKISGTKVFITGIMDAQMVYLVAGKTIVDGEDVGPTVFIIDDLGFKVNEDWVAKKKNLLRLADRGMRITPWTREGFEFMMIKGTDQGYIQLDNFEVPYDNVLGPAGKDEVTGNDGKKVPLRSLNKGRAGFAYLASTAHWFMRRQAEWAADRQMFDMYAPKRGESGRQGFMEFPLNLIGRSAMKAEVLAVLSRYTSALIDANPNSAVAALSALIKVRASEWNWENAIDALELGGGHALIKNAPGRVYQSVLDSWIARIVEGVNPAMSQFPHMMAGGKVMKALGTPMGILKALYLQTVNFFLPFFVTSKGALKRSDAKFVQRKTASFAMRFGGTAMFLGVIGFFKFVFKTGKYWKLFWPPAFFAGVMKSSQIEFAPKQNTLIRAFEAQADILSLAMVQTELAREKNMPATRRWILEKAVKVLRWRINQSLRYMTPWGHPVENIQVEIGRRIMAEEMAAPGDRPNRVQEHLDFLKDTADKFYARMRAEEVK